MKVANWLTFIIVKSSLNTPLFAGEAADEHIFGGACGVVVINCPEAENTGPGY
jgi:hypothetical protein